MKILHVGIIAGVPASLSRIDKSLGNESTVLCTYYNPFKYHCDKTILLDSQNFIPGNVTKYIAVCMQADRIHIHGRAPLHGMEIPVFVSAGKEVIYHYHGSEIRGKKQPAIHKLAHKFFVSTPDLLEFVPGAVWLPNTLIEEDLPKRQKNETDSLKLLHIPSKPKIKGSEFVDKAVEDLLSEGYKIEYNRVENVSHSEALRLMSECDVYVDQLLLGYWGVSALECAALGVPVICNCSVYETPFIQATPTTIYDTIKTVCGMSQTELKEVGDLEICYYNILREAAFNVYSEI